MEYFQIILEAYKWQGLTLVGLLILLLLIQFYYYTFQFRPLGKFSIKKRQVVHDSLPPISLVVPMFTEDYDYLDETLPLILAQEGVEFEIVIVYVGCDKDFYDDMVRLKGIYPNIVATKIERNERFPISIKTALNVGIKASHYEQMIFSTTDARPVSSRWLSLMAKGFQRGDVVLGYSGVEVPDNKFDLYFVRVNRFMESLHWLSKAIKGKPYRGIRSNFGFTRKLYFSVNGFNYLNMNIGEDDLFLQKIMKDNNASVILSPRATVLQKCWGRFDGLVDTQRFFGSSAKLYPNFARNFVAWELTSRVLFFLVVLVSLVALPLEIKLLALLLSAARVGFVLNSVSAVAKRVGEAQITGRYIFYDLLSPLFAAYMRLVMVKRDKRVWR